MTGAVAALVDTDRDANVPQLEALATNDDDVTRFLAPSAPGMGVMFLVAIGRRGRAATLTH